MDPNIGHRGRADDFRRRFSRRRLRQSAVLASATVVLGVALAACGGSADTAAADQPPATSVEAETSAATTAGPAARIAYIPPTTANPTEQAAEVAMQAAAEQLGIELTILGGEFDPSAQIVAVDAALQGDFDGLIIWPLDPQGIRPSLEKVAETGIPIMVLDSPSAEPHTLNIALDDYQTEYDTAGYVAETLKAQGKPCKVGIIEGLPVVEILADRNRGMEEGAAAAGCTILDQQVSSTDDATGARVIVDAWKTKFGSEMTAILAYNDPSAMGAVAAVDADFQPLIAGNNGDSIALDAIRNGTLLATIAINTAEWGAALVHAMNALVVEGEELPETISIDYVKVNRDNLESFEEALQQPVTSIDFVTRGDEVYAVAK